MEAPERGLGCGAEPSSGGHLGRGNCPQVPARPAREAGGGRRALAGGPAGSPLGADGGPAQAPGAWKEEDSGRAAGG